MAADARTTLEKRLAKPGTCLKCGERPRSRCFAEDYGAVVGREGDHRGDCWGGRFPTVEQAEEWLARLAKPAEQQAPVEVRLAPEQLEFNL
jgi:hypothetical protein